MTSPLSEADTLRWLNDQERATGKFCWKTYLQSHSSAHLFGVVLLSMVCLLGLITGIAYLLGHPWGLFHLIALSTVLLGLGGTAAHAAWCFIGDGVDSWKAHRELHQHAVQQGWR